MARLIPAEPAGPAVDAAADVLERGGTLAFPTDTVYGLGALPSHPDATRAIFDLKQRPADMHLAVLLSGASQMSLVTNDRRPEVGALMDAFWPGGLTLVLPEATELVASLNSGDGTIGVRCPNHELIRQLAARVGPIAATSANRHGQPTPGNGGAVADALPGVDLVLDAEASSGQASTVLSVLGEVPHILRPGPVTEEQILAVWAGDHPS